MRKFAQAHRAGHARTALERMQRAPQSRHRLFIARITTPPPNVFAGLRKQLRRLVEEDREHLRVDIVVHIRQRIDRRGQCGNFILDFRGDALCRGGGGQRVRGDIIRRDRQ